MIVPRASSVFGGKCKIRGSGVPEDDLSHIVVRTCEKVQVVAKAICSLKSLKNRRFHSPTFTQDTIQYVLYTLRFLFIHVASRQARTHCRAVTVRAVAFYMGQHFLMLSMFVSTSVSHAVELFDALAESER